MNRKVCECDLVKVFENAKKREIGVARKKKSVCVCEREREREREKGVRVDHALAGDEKKV